MTAMPAPSGPQPAPSTEAGPTLAFEERDCPLCRATTHEEVATRGRDGRPLRTVLCTQCGHVFTNPAPTAASLAAFYRDSYRQAYKQIVTPRLKHIYRAGCGALARLRGLVPHIAAGARVIDIGAGGGEFVYLLARRGYAISGIEPHAGYAAYARTAYGIDVDNRTLETATFPPGAADAVTLHHVLEHTVEPVDVLRQVWTWLKPGGVLGVEVPNLASWSHAPQRRFHLAHLHTFHHAGLEDLLANTGFTVVNITPRESRAHLTVIARKTSLPAQVTWRAEAGASRALLAAHTSGAHILSGQPLRRLWINAARPIREALGLRALGSPTDGRGVLDALYGRAAH
jgi:2-polyprenyl-3-methyl-5-hydroxy-6-metoxy-1,4-benzoquinol methylase